MDPNTSIQEWIAVNSSTRIFLSTILLLAMLFGGIPVSSAHAASTWTVTSAADDDYGFCDRDCTLREAMEAAESGDTIVFARNMTITLTSQLPALYKKITIKGKGAANTIIQASDCNPV